MKPMKVAAVVAGSVMALGAATPAFAAEGMSLNGGLETVLSEGLKDPRPLNTNALDTENPGSVLNVVKGATDSLNKKKGGKANGKTAGKKTSGKTGAKEIVGTSTGNKLLGGLPLGK
ncbi:hypothetical protein ACFRMN_24185 [Streptomyces sp. NPDC056835]|uniref:hypothetical protein n=1 Tax=Streptomyces sp. NPDC056835 TaxID=3345956 RepID=UPI0036C3FB50